MKKTKKAAPSLRSTVITLGRKSLKSIWLFPAVCTLILILLTAFRISGSSMGIYSQIFNGPGHQDKNLILNKPQGIRSDEWVWNSQMIMAQSSSGFHRINPNMGHGEDMSVIIDVPYKEWSALFRPQNMAFFVLPFQYAFAFKWWLMGYLLVLSCYFFILSLLPNKRLLAASLASALFFTPFVQWWYQYITLAPLFYSLFTLTAFTYFLRTKNTKHAILLGIFIGYLLTCFALVLYPPFQIACALAMAAFAVGFLITWWQKAPRKELLQKLGILGGSLVIAGACTLLFVQTRSEVVHTIANTAYPGKRIEQSGGFNAPHVFSGHLGFQFQSATKASKYSIPQNGLTNQSESSNFILLLPFLILPGALILISDYRRKRTTDWPLLLTSLTFIGAMAWLFIPHLDLLGKPFLLDKVPLTRMLIGIGLLNLLYLVLVVRRLQDFKSKLLNTRNILIYAGIIFVIQIALGIHAKDSFPGFIGIYRVLLFSIPIPVIMFLLLKKRFTLAAVGYFAFSLFMTFHIHPFYRGTDVITNTPLSRTIRTVAAQDSGKWAVEDSAVQNFPFLNGAPSLSGIYSYPQLDIWRSIDPTRASDTIYNRYAHTNFTFDRDPTTTTEPSFVLTGGDHYGINIEPCSPFMKAQGVRFILTSVPLDPSEQCVELKQTVSYPAKNFFIYQIN